MMKQSQYIQKKKKIRIIECHSLDFVGKDIISIKDWEDFIWMLGDMEFIYRLKESYYIITAEVAWVYNGTNKDT